MASEEKPIGALFGRLLEDGEAYARAEIELVKARVDKKIVDYRAAAIIAACAALLGIATLVALVVTLVLWLASLLGPLVGGLLATTLVAAATGILAMVAKKKFDDAANR